MIASGTTVGNRQKQLAFSLPAALRGVPCRLAAEVERAAGDPLRVALGLGEHVLRPQPELLGLDDPELPGCGNRPRSINHRCSPATWVARKSPSTRTRIQKMPMDFEIGLPAVPEVRRSFRQSSV